jgi:dipeptidyl aminopeptidase/acylaminoacyl peptidase
MRLPRLRRRVLAAALAALVLAALPVWLAGCSALTAGRLLQDALRPASALRDGVDEEEVEIPGRRGATRAVLIRPRDVEGPLPAFLLCPGAVQDGPEDPRMLAMARALALRGATVASVDLPALRDLRVDPWDVDRIVECAAWLAGREDLAEDGRVALLGICVGGSYAIIAAGDREIAGAVSGVFAFGAYDDLEELILHWMVTPGTAPQLFDPLTEGRRRVFLGNARGLVEPDDVDFVKRWLRAQLDREPLPAEPDDLGPRARRVLAAARSTGPLTVAEAELIVDPLRGELEGLSPASAAREFGATVYLLHGLADPVVPFASGEALRDALTGRLDDVTFHGTDLFGHVDTRETPSLWEAWPLLRFVGSFLDDGGL